MPSSPSQVERVQFRDEPGPDGNNGFPGPCATSKVCKQGTPSIVKSYSQPISYVDAVRKRELLEPSLRQPNNAKIDKPKDTQFESFRTLSGKQETEPEMSASQSARLEYLPVHRYYDALEGPELDTLRATEELVLPEDLQWPFLLHYPVFSFGVCLGLSSQTILWKTIATSSATRFLNIDLDVNLILWSISAVLIATVSFIYSLKIIFYFEAVRREFYHPIRINFFFAPWITLLFLALGIPPSISLEKNLPTPL
ncbi:hypothetical protein IFM89_029836 [Coptis chinensis]|uniref:Uncharacterized protein n=1 Tax=Coptis chinensis TaxID=261450 RepID=A0A835HQD5_9MAGN|nr:hypothetical protein IFM89_029836 [Coptis chinensis]